MSPGRLDNIDGYSAALLWERFEKSKKKEYLETLLAYNNEDIINLEFLLYKAYNLLIEKEPVFIPPLEFSKKEIKNPYLANKRVVDEILGKGSKFYS